MILNNLDEIYQEVLEELSYRVGIVNLKDEYHFALFTELVEQSELGEYTDLVIESLCEADDAGKIMVKNIKSGNIYPIDKSGFKSKIHQRASSADIEKEKQKESEPKKVKKPKETDSTPNLNLKPEEVAKKTAALTQVIAKDFSPELKKSLGETGIKTLVSGFEKMISGQKVNAQEKELLEKFVAFKDKSGEATLYIANVIPGNFKKHKKVKFPATKREELKQLTQSFGLQSTKAQEGALGKKELVPNKVTESRKTIVIEEANDGSITIDGVKHKSIAVPTLNELVSLLKNNGVLDPEIEAKATIASLKRYNKQLEMMKTAGKFEIVDFGDTSTPDGRQSTFDNIKKLYVKKFEQLFKENGGVTSEQQIIIDKFKSIEFNQSGSNPNFEKELDDLLSTMTLNTDFRTAVPDLLEVIVFSKMIGRGYQAFLPSSETFKVSDVIAFKEPNFKFSKSGNIAQTIADNFKMIKTSLVLIGGSSVKFAEGGAGQSDSKVEQTEYKHIETRARLESLLNIHQFVYGRSKDTKYPPSVQDTIKKEKEIISHLNWALKNKIITKDEYNRIVEQADKQSENAFQTAMRNGVGPLSDKEKMEYKKLLRLHALAGASIETINNNDTDFNYFSNERSTVNEKTGVVVNEELDGIVKKCCMSWSYNPGFKFTSFGGKTWMSPNNKNPSHIVSCDKKKK
jgi:hypothetical protein